ncbi:hypothetical protein QTN25_009559 [Entamoeba marina]
MSTLMYIDPSVVSFINKSDDQPLTIKQDKVNGIKEFEIFKEYTYKATIEIPGVQFGLFGSCKFKTKPESLVFRETKISKGNFSFKFYVNNTKNETITINLSLKDKKEVVHDIQCIIQINISPCDYFIDYQKVNFDENKVLGAGGYGSVFPGKYQNHPVAIKNIKNVKDFEKELEILVKTASEYTVKLYGCICKNIDYYIIMEKATTSFENIYKSIPTMEHIKIISDTLNEFILHYRQQPPTIGGSPCYIPPECTNGAFDLIDKHSDIFSFGMMVYYLFIRGEFPTSQQNIENIIKEVNNIEYVQYVSPDFLNYIKSSISKDCESRPTVSDGIEMFNTFTANDFLQHKKPIEPYKLCGCDDYNESEFVDKQQVVADYCKKQTEIWYNKENKYLQIGKEYFNKHKSISRTISDEVLNSLIIAAETIPECMYTLGKYYLEGYNDEINVEGGIDLLLNAMEHHYIKSEYLLILAGLDKKLNIGQFVRWINLLSMKKDEKFMIIPLLDSMAYEYSCKSMFLKGMWNLIGNAAGCCLDRSQYYFEEIISYNEKYFKLMMPYLFVSIEKNLYGLANNLAVLYALGLGIKQDNNKAHIYFDKAKTYMKDCVDEPIVNDNFDIFKTKNLIK